MGKIIKQPLVVSLNPNRMTHRACRYPEMEAQLYNFFLTVEDKVVLTDDLLWVKANNLLKELKADAKVSLAWVCKFKRRHGIKRRTRHGEAGNVDTATVEAGRRELQELIDQYSAEDVFNPFAGRTLQIAGFYAY